jgi:hypothetical protein
MDDYFWSEYLDVPIIRMMRTYQIDGWWSQPSLPIHQVVPDAAFADINDSIRTRQRFLDEWMLSFDGAKINPFPPGRIAAARERARPLIGRPWWLVENDDSLTASTSNEPSTSTIETITETTTQQEAKGDSHSNCDADQSSGQGDCHPPQTRKQRRQKFWEEKARAKKTAH